MKKKAATKKPAPKPSPYLTRAELASALRSLTSGPDTLSSKLAEVLAPSAPLGQLPTLADYRKIADGDKGLPRTLINERGLHLARAVVAGLVDLPAYKPRKP